MHPDANDFEDEWPRTPVTDDLPADWPMVKMHLKLALMAVETDNKNSVVLAETEHQIQQALWHLRPPAQN